MGATINLGRRRFLQISAAAGGGLLVGFQIPALARGMASEPAEGGDRFVPNAWIRIDPDDHVTVMVGSSEMGQGVMTSIPMLAAEELDADWQQVTARFAPADKAYTNPIIGQQLTGGSTAVRAFWKPVREAGAAAREVLIAAAAKIWGVSAHSCHAEAGQVIHGASGRKLRYGQLVHLAAKMPVPASVLLKEPDEFRLIGKPVDRLDVPAKVDGGAVFGQDVQLPGMLVATVRRCPVFGGKLGHFDATKAKAVKGVRHVMPVASGFAVVADTFWAAKQGLEAVQVSWDKGTHAGLDSDGITRQFQQALDHGATAARHGNAEHALSTAARTVEADYQVPYLAHACMEPMNCTADVRADGCDVWVPTQAQTRAQATAAGITGLPIEKVQIHTTFLGGGFGRRSEQDFLADAVNLSKQVGAPVKVLWTREEDTRHDFYRPAAYSRLRAGLDGDGMPVAWLHRIASPSIMNRVAPGAIHNGIDNTSVEGAANLPYAIPNLHVTYAMVNPGVPVGFWRSVGSSQNAYITECFLDEVAAAAGKDPFELRRHLLRDKPRHRKVLETAAQMAGWGRPLPKGRFRGVAVAEAFTSYCAQVAEVSVAGGQVRVHRVVCAIDCGTVVNPNTVEAQMESAIVYGLTAALKGEITIKGGAVQQGNFDDYQMLRMNEMPEVEVHIVRNGEAPGGIGEPGTPPIAPAVANAVFAATGKPVRSLPIRLSGA
ncbi:MAG: xanthine dehydrogenase family protein molybdopterin-binding subunit [Gammaproteobacteria bacterium]